MAKNTSHHTYPFRLRLLIAVFTRMQGTYVLEVPIKQGKMAVDPLHLLANRYSAIVKSLAQFASAFFPSVACNTMDCGLLKASPRERHSRYTW
jgi:hypothetical protein